MAHIPNCNLDLCLSPPSSSSTNPTSTSQQSSNPISQSPHPVIDLTELQARAILVRATRQMEERRAEATSSPVEQLPMKSGARPSTRIRSLQRFLHNRKHRIQTISPYSH